MAASTTGTRTWDYNFDGVAHYGMFADFVKDIRTAPTTPLMTETGKDLVDNHLLRSADYFFRMWQKIESEEQRAVRPNARSRLAVRGFAVRGFMSTNEPLDALRTREPANAEPRSLRGCQCPKLWLLD